MAEGLQAPMQVAGPLASPLKPAYAATPGSNPGRPVAMWRLRRNVQQAAYAGRAPVLVRGRPAGLAGGSSGCISRHRSSIRQRPNLQPIGNA